MLAIFILESGKLNFARLCLNIGHVVKFVANPCSHEGTVRLRVLHYLFRDVFERSRLYSVFFITIFDGDLLVRDFGLFVFLSELLELSISFIYKRAHEVVYGLVLNRYRLQQASNRDSGL